MAFLVGTLAGAPGAVHARELDEVELVRAMLQGPALRAELDAVRARGAAAGIAAPASNPVLEAAHEQANGPAGASTDIVGASWTLDLGLSGVSEASAARLRARAAESWVRTGAVDRVCDARAQALELWHTTRRATVAADAHGRIERLLEGARALSTGGELSGFERDRIELSSVAHLGEVEAQVALADAVRGRVSALAGLDVDGVRLASIETWAAGEGLVERALSEDPLRSALIEERQAAAVSLRAARRAGLPDLELTAGARWDAMPDGSSRTGGYQAGLGLELPVFDRNQAAVAAARVELAELDAHIAGREAQLRAQVEAAWRQVQRMGSVPKSIDTTSVWTGARARFVSGEGSLEELLSVAAEIEAAELAAVDARSRRHRARLALSCAVGSFPEAEFQALVEEVSQ